MHRWRLDCQRYGLNVFHVFGGTNGMKILEEDINLHDIDAYSLRGKHFYNSIVNFRTNISF